jgi:EAL domain-containing protein (putative c-di-GMP-specific phosphodiesterase class I)/GGDEF domain-containing protein
MSTEPERLRFIFSNLHEAVLVEDENRDVKYVNDAFTRLFAPGLAPEQLIGADCDAAAVASAPMFVDPAGWLARTRAIVHAKRNVQGDTCVLADGRVLERDYFPRVVEDDVIEQMWVYRDRSESSRDRSDGTNSGDEESSYRGWEASAAKFAQRIGREGGSCSASVVLVKLLVLERVNSELGYRAGDQLINEVVSELSELFGETNVERVRGATFAVVARGLEPTEAFSRIRARLDLSRPVGQQVMLLRYVMAAAHGSVATANDAEALLGDAFTALTEAIVTFADVVCDDALRTRAAVRFDIEARLQPALEAGEFELFFQPVKDLTTMKVEGAESLIRWRHPERGFIAASEFIPAIERLGLTALVDRWVIDRACADLPLLVAAGIPRIGINLSPQTFSSGHDVLQLILDSIERHGVAREQLIIEITETAVTADVTRTVEVIRNLHEAGLAVAIDDFGVGASSLGLLKDIPFDILKLDKSFIEDVEQERVQGLIQAICVMAGILGGEVVAEGVENLRQLEILRECGVHMGQGYYLGRPASVTGSD